MPCADSTFTSEPNGLLNCLSCAVCDPGKSVLCKKSAFYIQFSVHRIYRVRINIVYPLTLVFLTEQGLRVKTACTQISDTVCEPLEGFYCTNDEKGSCTQAVEHTKCSPGQYIKQKGWCNIYAMYCKHSQLHVGTNYSAANAVIIYCDSAEVICLQEQQVKMPNVPDVKTVPTLMAYLKFANNIQSECSVE